jgi:uncharacterized protein (DUF3820 family)
MKRSPITDNNEPFTDDSLMPFGAYCNIRLGSVPDEYLLWVYANVDRDTKDPRLFAYIEENLDALNANVKRKKPKVDPDDSEYLD